MYIRIRYELENFQALKQNTDVDRVLESVLDHAESAPIMQLLADFVKQTG